MSDEPTNDNSICWVVFATERTPEHDIVRIPRLDGSGDHILVDRRYSRKMINVGVSDKEDLEGKV